MKVSYLILAHNNFEHLQRLIEALNDANSSFYIHIDKKANSNAYVPQSDNVTIIPTHIDIKWGGYSMIEATVALAKYALSHNPDSDYFILLSGVDYPIRSKKFLEELLVQKKEYIDIVALPIEHKPMERFEYYYFDYNRRPVRHYNPFFIAEVLMKKLKIKRRIPFKLYAGTQWFALTKQCMEYIIHTIDTDKRYERFFRHTLVPDEALFQTIIGNSTFATNTATCLVYTDWNVPVPPAIISDKHIDLLKNKFEFVDEYGKRLPYFARKFSDDNTAIIERIKNELIKKDE